MVHIFTIPRANFGRLTRISNYRFKTLAAWLLAVASSGVQAQTTSQDQEVSQAIKAPNAVVHFGARSGGPDPAASTEYIYLHAHQIAEVKR